MPIDRRQFLMAPGVAMAAAAAGQAADGKIRAAILGTQHGLSLIHI